MRSKRGELLRRVLQVALTVPGGGMTVLPAWPQLAEVRALRRAGELVHCLAVKPACRPYGPTCTFLPALGALQALQKAGAKPMQTSGGDRARTGESGDPSLAPAAKSENGGGGAAAPAAVSAAPAAPPPSGPSPVMQQPQWTPPGAATTPTSFLDILNAEITSPEQAEPAWQVPPAALQQALPGGYSEPVVQGLPLPPGAAPQALGGSGVLSGVSSAVSAAAGASGGSYALIHTAQVVVDPKVMGSGPLLLGMGQASGAGERG